MTTQRLTKEERNAIRERAYTGAPASVMAEDVIWLLGALEEAESREAKLVEALRKIVSDTTDEITAAYARDTLKELYGEDTDVPHTT